MSKEVPLRSDQDTATLPPLFPNAIMKHLYSCIPLASRLIEQVAGSQSEFHLNASQLFHPYKIESSFLDCAWSLCSWQNHILQSDGRNISITPHPKRMLLTVLVRSDYLTSLFVVNNSSHGLSSDTIFLQMSGLRIFSYTSLFSTYVLQR